MKLIKTALVLGFFRLLSADQEWLTAVAVCRRRAAHPASQHTLGVTLPLASFTLKPDWRLVCIRAFRVLMRGFGSE